MPESTKPHTQRRRPGTRNPTGCGGPGGRFGVAPRASAGVRGAVSVVRGGNLPAAVQSIVPGGGGRGARDVAQLSDRELRVELAVSSAWTYREHSRWWSEETSGEQFLRMLEACGPAAVLLG